MRMIVFFIIFTIISHMFPCSRRLFIHLRHLKINKNIGRGFRVKSIINRPILPILNLFININKGASHL